MPLASAMGTMPVVTTLADVRKCEVFYPKQVVILPVAIVTISQMMTIAKLIIIIKWFWNYPGQENIEDIDWPPLSPQVSIRPKFLTSLLFLTWSREIEELLEDSALSNPESPSLAFLKRKKISQLSTFSTSGNFQWSLTVVYPPFSGHRIHKPLPDTRHNLKLRGLQLVSKTVCAVWVFSIADFWSFRLRIVFWCCLLRPSRPPPGSGWVWVDPTQGLPTQIQLT